MHRSLALTFVGPAGQPPTLERLARFADDAGLRSVWVSDHVLFPATLDKETYPYASNGAFDNDGDRGCLDSLTTLAWLAAIAPRVRLGVGVLVLPQRNPVIVAKVLSTLDVLSGGRAELGVGAGWCAEEFAALGADFANRGAVLDEYLQVIDTLFRDRRPQFSGTHYSISDVIFEPKPVQRPGPPLHVGGNSPAAVRRAARVADVWQAVSLDVAGAADARARLDRACEQIGRDPGQVRLGLRCFFHLTGTPNDEQVLATAPAAHLVGSADQLGERLAAYAEAGVTEIFFSPLLRHDAQLYVDQVQRFVSQVEVPAATAAPVAG